MDSVSGSAAARSATVSIGRRLALAVAAVVVAGVALLVSVQTFSASRDLRATAENGTLTLSERLVLDAAEVVRWRKVPAIDAFLEGVAANQRVDAAALAVFDETGKLLTAKASPDHVPFDLEAAFAAKREDADAGRIRALRHRRSLRRPRSDPVRQGQPRRRLLHRRLEHGEASTRT